MVRRGARLERTDATTLVRLSAWDPRSTWCPAAGPGPGKAGRRRCLPGARGQSRYPPELGGREVASQPAEKGGGAAPAHARRAPPRLPRLLDSAREEGKGGGGADGPRAALPVTAPARAGGRGGDGSR